MSARASLEAAASLVFAELARQRRVTAGELYAGPLAGDDAQWPALSELLSALGVNVGDGEVWLDEDVEPLSEPAIAATLSGSARAWLRELEIPLLVDSTNTRLMARSREGGSIDGFACLAESQSAGRGRRGRHWYSPFGRNIALSLGLRLPRPASELTALSLAVGLAAIDTLLSSGVEETALKWPNDLLLQERKLGGILIELARTGSQGSEVVIGIGLNMAGSRSLAGRIDQPVADLSEVELPLSRNALAGRLISAIHEYGRAYGERGFAPMREAWERFNLHQGRPVTVQSGGELREGVVQGVDESGALLLRRAGGIERISGGEVSLRAGGGTAG